MSLNSLEEFSSTEMCPSLLAYGEVTLRFCELKMAMSLLAIL
jgi:hypothetical protein